MSEALPPEVQAALAGFAGGQQALASSPVVTRLSGGAANRVWRVTSPVGDWVVRLAGPVDAHFAINRIAERQVHAAAAKLGFAPEIIHADTAIGLLMLAHLPGPALTAADLHSRDRLEALGARIGELHAVPPPRGVRRLDVHEVLAHYMELPGIPEGPVSRRDLGARLRWSLASYRQKSIGFCHNDLHHLNVIDAGRLMFVDWEYGGVGDPLFELAAVIRYHDLDAGEREVLLAAHGGTFKPKFVDDMCLVFDCLHALWLDAAGAWGSLGEIQREALLARLRIDPAERIL